MESCVLDIEKEPPCWLGPDLSMVTWFYRSVLFQWQNYFDVVVFIIFIENTSFKLLFCFWYVTITVYGWYIFIMKNRLVFTVNFGCKNVFGHWRTGGSYYKGLSVFVYACQASQQFQSKLHGCVFGVSFSNIMLCISFSYIWIQIGDIALMFVI